MNQSRLDTRKHFSTQKVVDAWNSLAEVIINAKTVNSFKNRSYEHYKIHLAANAINAQCLNFKGKYTQNQQNYTTDRCTAEHKSHRGIKMSAFRFIIVT